jgi:molybdenum cofactor cytidylyltransferase
VSTVAIILAADTGEGFETPKYLAPMDGTPMLVKVLEDSKSWNVDSRVVVLGPDAEMVATEVAAAETSNAPATVIIDPEWAEGASSPLRVALDFVMMDHSVTNCLVARGDQPGVTADIVDALLHRAEETHADAVVPKYRYATGWPVLIGHSLLERLRGMEGEFNLHEVISMHAAAIEECWFDQLTPPVLNTSVDLLNQRR